MLSNNGLCLCSTHRIFLAGGILTSFNFTELHTLTLAARSYALLPKVTVMCVRTSWSFVIIHHHSNEPYSITQCVVNTAVSCLSQSLSAQCLRCIMHCCWVTSGEESFTTLRPLTEWILNNAGVAGASSGTTRV